MASRNLLRQTVAVALLCGSARPVFADGVFPTDAEWNRFLIEVATVFVTAVGALILLIVMVRKLVRSRRAAAARRASAAEPTVPTARVVPDRKRP